MALLLSVETTLPAGQAEDMTKELVVKYLLATVHAFQGVMDQVKKAGIEPQEDWTHDHHAIMLAFQFVKLAGAKIKDFEIGLISLTPIYTSNFPKTETEANALTTLAASPNRSILTFGDGNQFKGIMADLAIEQACAIATTIIRTAK